MEQPLLCESISKRVQLKMKVVYKHYYLLTLFSLLLYIQHDEEFGDSLWPNDEAASNICGSGT
jgi:hypothetical protein